MGMMGMGMAADRVDTAVRDRQRDLVAPYGAHSTVVDDGGVGVVVVRIQIQVRVILGVLAEEH